MIGQGAFHPVPVRKRDLGGVRILKPIHMGSKEERGKKKKREDDAGWVIILYVYAPM